MLHYARTPTRIDLAGGWTDVPRFAEVVPGAVLNFAINRYSHVRIREARAPVEPRYGRRVPVGLADDRISMYSIDYDAREVLSNAAAVHDVELSGSFGLVKAALRRRRVDRGLEILTRSEAPPGSGLGTSASMGVALIGALNRVLGVVETPDEVAETAVALETEELGILSGKQDHYAAALGGIQFMTFQGELVQSFPLALSRTEQADLQRRLVLVYTGKSRLSSDLHRHVVARFEAREAGFLQHLEDLAAIARSCRDALLQGRFDELGRLVHQNWQIQKALYEGISTDEIETLYRQGMKKGAIGMKACGAGGGGCLVFVCEDGAEGHVARSLTEIGAEVLSFDIVPDGLLTWTRSP